MRALAPEVFFSRRVLRISAASSSGSSITPQWQSKITLPSSVIHGPVPLRAGRSTGFKPRSFSRRVTSGRARLPASLRTVIEDYRMSEPTIAELAQSQFPRRNPAFYGLELQGCADRRWPVQRAAGPETFFQPMQFRGVFSDQAGPRDEWLQVVPQNCRPDRSAPGFPATRHSPAAACAAFSKESRKKFANANDLNRKFGVAQWRDLRFLFRFSRSLTCG
jgi:hypothetical protein